MLKYYFQLFRIPNLFTVPPDIIAGYVLTTSSNFNNINYFDLLILVFSSIFLYIGGLITNDLFDINEDRKQRPSRPLVSGKIKVSTTIILAILFFGSGILMTSFLKFTSTIISVILVLLILLYNYKLKNGPLRPISMGSIRSINIIYGSSLNNIFFNNFNFEPNYGLAFTHLINLIVITIAVFIHIYTLTLLSKRETEQEDKELKEILNLKSIYKKYLFSFILLFSADIIFMPNKIAYLSFFIMFVSIITILFYNILSKGKYNHYDFQFLVKNMIILLILLDSIFIAGELGFYVGLLISCLLIPCIIIGKKVNMT